MKSIGWTILLALVALAQGLSAQALSGTYTIANGNPGSAYDYGDLGGAFDALELNGVSGPVVLELYDVGGPFTSNGSYQLGGNISTLQPVAGLSATNTLTIRAAPNNSPVIQGSGAGNRYSTTFFGTLSFDQVNYVTIDGLEITGGAGYGITWLTWNGPLIETVAIRNCRIHGITAGAAIVFYYPATGGGANNVTIENNMCWNCYGDGGSSLLFGRVKGVIGSGRSGTNWVVRHNTIIHDSTATDTGVYFNSGLGTIPWADFSYNVTYFTNAAAAGYYRLENASAVDIPANANRNVVYLGGSATMCNNTTYGSWAQWQAAGKDPNGVNADPLLTSVTAPVDLRLLPGSPAIDLAVGSPVTSDIFGNPRPAGPAPDAGAHEAPSGPPPDMEVELAAAPIADGGSISLGDVPLAGGAFIFDILNTGAGDLYLLNTPPVQLTPDVNCGPGTVVQAQPASPIASQGSDTFTVFVEPAGLGALSFNISIANTDVAKNPYDFTVTANIIPNNAPAVAGLAAGSAFSAGGGLTFTLAVGPGATLANAIIELTDPDADPIDVTDITPVGATPTGIVAPGLPAPAHPVQLEWTGQAQASNPPQSYSWDVTFADTVNGTPTTITVTISINDLPPTHTILDATGGTGGSTDPYTAGFTHSDTGADDLDLATVTDPNTSQILGLGAITPDAGNPAGGSGFMFSLAGGSVLNVAPAGTLQTADMGMHNFEVEVSDGTHTVSIHVRLEVVGLAPSITSSPLLSATPGQLYTYMFTATGIPTPTLNAGTLPAWLTFNPATGELSGTPPNTASKNNFSITLTAANGVPPDATQTFTIAVGAVPGGSRSDGDGGGGCAAAAGPGLVALLALALLPVWRRRKNRDA